LNSFEPPTDSRTCLGRENHAFVLDFVLTKVATMNDELDWKPTELFRSLLGLPEPVKVFVLKPEHLKEISKYQDNIGNHMTVPVVGEARYQSHRIPRV
jgi:hypothetical protein